MVAARSSSWISSIGLIPLAITSLIPVGSYDRSIGSDTLVNFRQSMCFAFQIGFVIISLLKDFNILTFASQSIVAEVGVDRELADGRVLDDDCGLDSGKLRGWKLTMPSGFENLGWSLSRTTSRSLIFALSSWIVCTRSCNF